jgi:hypothetical protein
MNRLAICGLIVTFAALGYAAEFSGKLLDAACYDQAMQNAPPPDINAKSDVPVRTPYDVAETCAPTALTTTFAFMNLDGKIYKFENASNRKAESAVQNGALVRDKQGYMRVKISGEIRGNEVMVRSVEPKTHD